MGERTAADPRTLWVLEGFDEERKVFRRVRIKPVPFLVGRNEELPLSLNRSSISRKHAELYFDQGELFVRDLESRNGTFVNRARIHSPHRLRPGDVVHFGTCEFRIWSDPEFESGSFGDTMEFSGVLPERFAAGTRDFLELLQHGAVEAHFQPLVHLKDRSIFGYEMLGRGAKPGAPRMPSDLFAIAAECNLETELSRLFRSAGIKGAARLDNNFEFFMNVHPAEMTNVPALLASLGDYRTQFPRLKFTVEIHESLVTDPESVREFRSRVSALGMKIAYDDFGAGQARLMELSEVPPDCLKFDRSLIHKISQAPVQRRQMLQMLVSYAHGLGVTTLAEGIETEEDATECANIGFDCAQGYFFGQPRAEHDVATQA